MSLKLYKEATYDYIEENIEKCAERVYGCLKTDSANEEFKNLHELKQHKASSQIATDNIKSGYYYLVREYLVCLQAKMMIDRGEKVYREM